MSLPPISKVGILFLLMFYGFFHESGWAERILLNDDISPPSHTKYESALKEMFRGRSGAQGL